MRVLPVLIVLTALPAFAEEIAPEKRAFVEIVAPTETIYVGQVFPLRLRIGYDPVFFEKYAVPLFRQEMDLPVQVTAPWAKELPGVGLTRRSAIGGVRFALNDAVVEATPGEDITLSGVTYAIVEVAWYVDPQVRAQLELAAPTLRFAHARQFEEDFVGGRVALDRKDVMLHGEKLTLRFAAVLEEDRPPPGYTGAYGDFEISAAIDRQSVRVGEIFRLTLRFTRTSSSDLGLNFKLPRLDGWDGFHVYGVTDRAEGQSRVAIYEIAATRPGISEIPAVPFAFRRADLSEWGAVATRPLPIEVRASDPPAARRVEPRVPDDSAPVVLWIAAGLVAGLLLGFLLRARGRPVRAAPAAQPEPAGPPAGQMVLPATPDGELAAFIAEHLGIPAASVIAPDSGRKLRAAGLPGDLADRTGALLEALVAARYGGADVAGDAAAGVRAELERAFENAPVPPAHSED